MSQLKWNCAMTYANLFHTNIAAQVLFDLVANFITPDWKCPLAEKIIIKLEWPVERLNELIIHGAGRRVGNKTTRSMGDNEGDVGKKERLQRLSIIAFQGFQILRVSKLYKACTGKYIREVNGGELCTLQWNLVCGDRWWGNPFIYHLN